VTPERLLVWVPRVFVAVGLGLVVGGAVWAVLTIRFVEKAERVTGTVVDISRERDSEGSVFFHPVVRFTVDQRTITFRSSSGSGNPPVIGDSVDVLYDPDDPQDAKLAGFVDLWLGPLVLGGIGVVALTVALVALRRTRKLSTEDATWLRTHGLRLEGASPRVVRNETIEAQGDSPFRVEVDVHDTVSNEVRVLTSENIWFDPTPHLEGRQALDVYVDPGRPDRYLVDVSFLPRRAE
jgi:hypothetical protein